MAKMNWDKVRQQKKTAHGNFEYVGNDLPETRICTESQYSYLKSLIKKSNANLQLAKKYNILGKKNQLKPRYELEKDLIKIVIGWLVNKLF